MLLVCWTQAYRNFVLFPVTHLPISSKCKILQDNIILFFPYDLRQISRLFSHLLMCYILISRSHSETPHSVKLLCTSDRPLQIPLPENRQPSPETDIHTPSTVWTCSPSMWAAADLCHRLRCHWDCLYIPLPYKIKMWLLFLMIVLVVITSVSTFFLHRVSLYCGCYFFTLTMNCYVHLSAICSAQYSILLLQYAHAAVSHTPSHMYKPMLDTLQ